MLPKQLKAYLLGLDIIVKVTGVTIKKSKKVVDCLDVRLDESTPLEDKQLSNIRLLNQAKNEYVDK